MSASRRDAATDLQPSRAAQTPQRGVAVLVLACALLLSACGDRSPPADTAATPAEPATDETAAAPDTTTPTEPAAAAPTAAAEFDPGSVPESTATLPPFPFFKSPDGLKTIFAENERTINFDRTHMIAGNKIVAIEGKIVRDRFRLTGGEGRQYTATEFHRNYENAIRDLGGVRISQTQYTREVLDAFGGFYKVGEHFYGACHDDIYGCENHTYLIRQAGKEYWILVSYGGDPQHGNVVALEREGMKQSLGFLDATAMKKAIDADGRVALYINFDIDKATLRPDAQPTIDEIGKLLSADPALKLSIEGHTDNTGSADHNRKLSTDRARSVLGALVGLGVDPARLQSTGFGQDKPIADNATDDGRAKNRRVELVKR